MQGIIMQIENAQAVQNALDSFEKKISKKIVRQGVRASWKPLLDRSKENARNFICGRMGKLIASKLQLRAWRRQKRGQYAMLVRIKPGVDEFVSISKSGNRAFIPVALEYGHAFPYHGGRGAAKDVPARPFMRPALDYALPNAPKIFEQHLNQAIEEENRKK
jgi:phage gpG-like protein